MEYIMETLSVDQWKKADPATLKGKVDEEVRSSCL